jgi:hypothetical protein
MASWSRFTDSPLCLYSRRFFLLQVFVEANAVAERVDDLNALRIVKRRFDPWLVPLLRADTTIDW